MEKMGKQKSVDISVWTKKSRILLEKVKNLCNENSIDESDLPLEVYEEDKPISLVFAGQYSAGKSTILKALTGIDDIATGAGITTQQAHSYDWNGIKVVDTPGIHTTLRPDHDEISYLAIAKADMLVYVVTQELFDNFIGNNFRKLLIEKDKANEMILIVNKMAKIGNTLENQEIKQKDLEKVTYPYTTAQLRTVFIDAESYIDSLTETDEEFAEMLRTRSNFDNLVIVLNNFVKDAGIASKVTTVLYRLYDFLQNVIVKFEPSTGDGDIDALEEHRLQERRILFNAQQNIETSVKIIVDNAASQIRDNGRELANRIYDYKDEDEANSEVTKEYDNVEVIAETCTNDVAKAIENLSIECEVELNDFYNSNFSQSLKFRLKNKNHNGNPLIDKIIESDALAKGGSKIVSNTAGSNAAANGLKAFTGSNVHQMVLDIGHFFGHSFKPWEAVKWVKGINVAGKVLGVFGVALSLGMQAKEDIDAVKREREMKEGRENLRASFNNAANAMVSHFNNALGNYISENYQKRISKIDLEISEIRKDRVGKSEICKSLDNMQSECTELISEIHNSYSDSNTTVIL